MSSGVNKYHEDWDLQRERLSAYLDDELDAAEREPLERHLAQCEECRAALAELRQTRALLRALPAPTLPRSFALPIETPANVRSIAQTPTTPARIRARNGTASRLAQRIGSLAAAVGVVLLLGSWIVGLHGGPSGASSASRASQGGAAARQNTQLTTAGAPATHTPPVFAGSTRGADVATNAGATPAATQPTATATAEPTTTAQPAGGGSTSSAPVVPLTGAGLLFGGIVLVVAGKTTQTRRERRR
jgi:anti-sigma factor RsiW